MRHSSRVSCRASRVWCSSPITAESNKTRMSALDPLAREVLDRLVQSLVFAPRACSESKPYKEAPGRTVSARRPCGGRVSGGPEPGPIYDPSGTSVDIVVRRRTKELDDAGIEKLTAACTPGSEDLESGKWRRLTRLSDAGGEMISALEAREDLDRKLRRRIAA